MITIGVEGNNPGKIPLSQSPFRGEVAREEKLNSDYKTFRSAAWGYRAMYLILHNYDQLYGLRTVGSLIKKWCRGRNIDCSKYIEIVSRKLGCKSTSFVDTSDREVMTSIVSSISRIENGVPAVEIDVEVGWELFMQSRMS